MLPQRFRDNVPFPRQHNSPKRKGGNERVTGRKAAAAAAKSHQTLFNPIDGSPPGFAIHGRKARGLQMEEIGCKCQTSFLSLLSGRRKQTTSVRFLASLIAQLVKNPPAMQETLVEFLGWEDPWRRDRLPTPVFWPGEFHGLSSWGHKESDTTEKL